MSLKDYEVARDKFECDDAFSGYCFPCGACQHRFTQDSDDPCRSCDHNAKPDAGSGRCDICRTPADASKGRIVDGKCDHCRKPKGGA